MTVPMAASFGLSIGGFFPKEQDRVHIRRNG